MARVGVNMKGVGLQVANSKKFRAAARREVVNATRKAKLQMVEEFNSHPVTLEIEGGMKASNISNTLGGIGSGGNLFTYIGFDQGTNPTSPVRSYLQNSVQVGAVRAQGGGAGRRANATCTVFYPDMVQLKAYSPLPWEPGKSWIEGVENGIGGFGYYMHGKFATSRSGFGIQTRAKIRQGHFRTAPYISKIIHNFLKRLGINK